MYYILSVEPPWWGSPLIGAIAALLGAGITLTVTQLRNRSDARRRDQMRWDTLILETCVAVDSICEELAGIGRAGWPRYIEDATARGARYIELFDEMNRVHSRFRFVASHSLADAMLRLVTAALRLYMNDSTPGSGQEFDDARSAFVGAGREELRAN